MEHLRKLRKQKGKRQYLDGAFKEEASLFAQDKGTKFTIIHAAIHEGDD